MLAKGIVQRAEAPGPVRPLHSRSDRIVYMIMRALAWLSICRSRLLSNRFTTF
jgi:hypothetical protein